MQLPHSKHEPAKPNQNDRSIESFRLREHAGERVKVVEGNRRLAACFILSGDERAKDPKALHEKFSALHKAKKSPPISSVPVIIYEGKRGFKDVLPYLGIRHIAGSLPWDSYAKAAWADKTSQSSGYSLSDISQMIGDDSDTVTRLVEGLRFVKQLESTGQFNPEQSLRRGRGSNKEYPFSWVYTALGYNPIRKFAGLKDERKTISDKPIPANKLDDAGALMVFMFGNKLKGVPAAMSDSREFGELANAVDRPELREKLKQGRNLKQVIEEGRSAADRIDRGLATAADALVTMSELVERGDLERADAQRFAVRSSQVSRLANEFAESLPKLRVVSTAHAKETNPRNI